MASEKTILVTGASGKTGTALTARLRGAGASFRAGSRHNDGTTEYVPFDWDNEATHGPALEGADRVYLVAPIGSPTPEAVMVPFLHLALNAGVRRAVLLSSSAIPEGGPVLGQVHQAVHELMPEWTVLQPSWFMQNFTEGLHGESIRSGGEIVTATGEGRVGFIDAGDIAEVAFRALTDTAPHNGAHILTGPEALSYADAAAMIADAAGRPVRHRSLSPEALRERLTAAGIPEGYAVLLAGLDEAIKNGAEARVTPAVYALTGRAPKSLAEFARDNARAWSPVPE